MTIETAKRFIELQNELCQILGKKPPGEGIDLLHHAKCVGCNHIPIEFVRAWYTLYANN